jgi:DNA (cytosine-5)-methyltransferase 1
MEVKIVDLFSGAGGMTFGFYYSLKNGKFVKNKDCEIIFANEKDTSAAKAFKINYPDINMQNCDIKKLKEKTISDLIGTEEIDIIIGGPPCQSFTTIGVRKYDDKAKLYQEYIRMLKIIKPKMFIFENVKGILSMKDGANHSVIKKIVKKFNDIGNDLGYNVSYQTLDAVNFGIPQYRERVFIVGIRNDLALKWVFPKGNNSKLSIINAISDLTSLKQGEEKTEYKRDSSNEYQKLMRSKNKLLTYHRAALHDEKINMVIRNIKQGEGRFNFNQLIDEGIIGEEYRLTSGYKNTYGRLIGKNPSTTITHNMSTPSGLRCIHYKQNRALTPREGARIQSFPDTFQFYGNLSEVKSQVGNAVPPLLAIELYKQAKKTLSGEQKIAKYKK